MKATTGLSCITAWCVTAATIIIAISLTHSAWCLWAFLVPASVTWGSTADKKTPAGGGPE